uniref:DUF7587 domain-containing protein n=1 Tax=Globisporangium ultimum (strain ATCC 200006 / CBS 805.95 / DAOM BR144) TaxID=431595 RepID=K3WHV6_GLOUD
MDPNTLEVVKTFWCEPPSTLWRIQYGNNSLCARASPDFHDKDKFKDAVELHLDWYNRKPTPFVSSFENQIHATSFAKCLLKNGHKDVRLYPIDTTHLGPVFRVRDLNPSENTREYVLGRILDPQQNPQAKCCL